MAHADLSLIMFSFIYVLLLIMMKRMRLLMETKTVFIWSPDILEKIIETEILFDNWQVIRQPCVQHGRILA